MTTETPMIRQYREIKEKNNDKILLFRVGDFYEMFYEDAKIGARELEITLTSRETGKDNHVPLAGFPYHALHTYLGRFIERGYKVAICEQVEDPKAAKGIVRREIVQVITPGTVTDSTLLDEKANNYLVSIYFGRSGIGLAAVDISTGEFTLTQLKGKLATKILTDELSRLRPAEILYNSGASSHDILADAAARLSKRTVLNPLEDRHYSFKTAHEQVCRQFHVATLESLGCADLPVALPAAGALIAYLQETQQSRLDHLHKPAIYDPDGFMILDSATRRNLELTRTIREERKTGSLLWVLDKTKTAAGGRLLKRWLEQPLLDVDKICARLDAVDELLKNLSLAGDLQEHLDDVYDMERLLGRVHCENANARDLTALRSTLAILPDIAAKLRGGGVRMQGLAERLPDLSELTDYLTNSIAPDPPFSLREGGILRDGFHAEVDRLRHVCRHGKSDILQMEQQERDRTGIKSLKVGYNKVFGYYIEVSRVNLHLVPSDYIRKQTLANAERYITEELKEYEQNVLGAEDKVCALEYEVFTEIRRHVAGRTAAIQAAAAVLAELDVYQSLARVAAENRYVRPVVNNHDEIRIEDGRHPVVERVIQNELFVPNNVYIEPHQQQVLLITGPNMAGKSTYMRQTALIVLLAQIGSFVPARYAEIGLVDRIFTRIGAADDLVGGQSTFMVEMSEVANILMRATAKSLVILDEVGRGTSTFDGISIARAVVEYLCRKVKSRTMFATHYHELADLAHEFSAVVNYATAVKERGEDIVFLHKVIAGHADHSYGLQVAKLAGLPPVVIARAKEILLSLETAGDTKRETAVAAETQLRFFEPDPELANILAEIETADFMTTTPLEAMQLLFRLQQAVKKG